MIQFEKGPPRRQLRIQNRLRFILFLLLILLPVITFFIPQNTNGQVLYRTYVVCYGDTYWNIAKELQANGYKARADIRIVVDELVRQSGIPAHELMEGDTIYIPDMEGLQ